MNEDKILYDKFLQGDNKALEELIALYKEKLIMFLFSYLKNIDEAENMMIDVFARLAVSNSKFKGKSTFKTYIFTIARNEALHYIKKNKHHLSLDEIGENLFYENEVAEISLLRKEKNLKLYKALNKLPNDYRETLYLIYFEDMSYKETAKIMKKTEKQVTNLAYRSKKLLKEILEKEGFVYDE